MTEINFFNYQCCNICDGRGLIEIADEKEYQSICPCPLCNGTGRLQIKIEPDDIN